MKRIYLIFAIMIAFMFCFYNSNSKVIFNWGYNWEGQLAKGFFGPVNPNYPTKSGTETTWKMLETNGHFSLGIKSNGTLWAWGGNFEGAVGDGTTSNRNTPIQIGNESNWKMVACGPRSSYAIKNDGTLWAWGNNNFGQLGDGTTTNRLVPTQIGTENNWAFVSGGGSTYQVEGGQAFAIKTNGTLWAWGRNHVGQLGDSTYINRLSPIQIGSDNNWKFISCGAHHTIALKNDGTLWAWGINEGSFGDGSLTNRNYPIQVGVESNWKTIKSGYYYSLAIKNDGTLWTWGDNSWGQLGIGNTNKKLSPVQVGLDADWKIISASSVFSSSAAIKTDGSLWTWGKGEFGILGDNTESNKLIPTRVGSDNNWTNISVGLIYMQGLRVEIPFTGFQNICVGTHSYSLQVSDDFEVNNHFILELSNDAGNFDNPLTLGTLNSTGSGDIVFNVPNNLNQNGNYLARIRATAPAVSSSPMVVTLSRNSPPTTQAKTLLFSNVTSSSVRVKWTNGNGEKRIVLAKAGTTITEIPENGEDYTANAAYSLGDTIGGAYVVYVGTGNFVNVTGLNPNTNYTFKVFEYFNDEPCTVYNVNNGSMNPRTRKTAIAPPTIVTNYDKGTNYFTAEWTYAGVASYFEVDVSVNNQFTTYLPGWQTTDVGDLTEIIVDELNVNSLYYFRVRAIDANGLVSEWSAITAVRTLQTAPTNPAINAVVSSRTPNGFTLIWDNNGQAAALVLLSTSEVSANLIDGKTYVANANFTGNGEEVGNAKVIYNSTGNSINISGLSPNTEYYYSIFTYNGNSGLGNENYNTVALSGSGLTLASEPTVAPSAVTFSNIESNSMTVNWTVGNGEKTVVFAKEGPEAARANQALPSGYCTPSFNYNYLGSHRKVILGNIVREQSENYWPNNGFMFYSSDKTTHKPGESISYSVTTEDTYGGAYTNYANLIIWVDWNRDGQFNNWNEMVVKTTYNADSPNPISGNFTVPNSASLGETRVRVMTGYYYYMNVNSPNPCATTGYYYYGEATDYVFEVAYPSPKDGTTYIADSEFGNEPGYDNGWFTVYNGNGTSVDVSGLNPFTEYSFRAYTYNGDNGTENYLDNPAKGSETTLANTPTVAPSNMLFSNIGANDFDVNWTPGNGQNTLVLASTTNFFSAPTNNTEYIADADFTSENSSEIGNAKVVYAGNGSGFNVFGLDPNTTYYFAAYTYNGSGANSAFLTTPANGSESTLFATPTQAPANVNFTNNNITSFTINWTPGNGTNSLVILYEDDEFLDFANPQNTISYVASSDFGGNGSAIGSGKVVYNGTGSSVSISGLNPGTAYYAWVYTFNGTNNKTNYLWWEDVFELNQTMLAASKLVITGISPSGNLASGQTFSLTVESQDANNNPAFPLNNTTVNITFDGDGTLGGTLSKTINSNQTSVTFNNLVYTNANGEAGVDFTAKDNATILTQGTLNDVDFLATEPTTQERVLMFGSIGQTQMTVTWTKGNGSKRILVARAGAEIEDLPVDGVEYTANSIYGDEDSELGSGYVVYNGTEKSVTVTGLTKGTTYHFRAFGFNGAGSNTNYITNEASLNPRSKTTLGKEGDYAEGTEETLCDVIGNSLNISEITPNPTSDEIKFTMSNGIAEIGSLLILNSAGQEVIQIMNNATMPVGQTDYSVDVSILPAGMYLLYSQIGECVAVQKFIIIK